MSLWWDSAVASERLSHLQLIEAVNILFVATKTAWLEGGNLAASNVHLNSQTNTQTWRGPQRYWGEVLNIQEVLTRMLSVFCLFPQDLDDIEDENEQLKQENKTLLKVVGQLTR